MFEIIFTGLECEQIQLKVTRILIELCKKTEHEIPKVENLQGVQPLPSEMVKKLPHFFFFRLFWTQYLPHVLMMKQNTMIVRELFNFMNRLLIDTEISKYLHLI